MAHTPDDDKILKSMTMEDKIKSIQPNELKKQGTFLKDYNNRYTSTNKYPLVDRGPKQILARLKGKELTMESRIELYEIIQENGLEGICRNRKEDRSIENIHFHLFN